MCWQTYFTLEKSDGDLMTATLFLLCLAKEHEKLSMQPRLGYGIQHIYHDMQEVYETCLLHFPHGPKFWAHRPLQTSR